MNTEKSFRRHISPITAWALSIGTSVGWGSLVVTSSTYLVQAGPLGSVLGLLIGTAVMLLISRSYAYMMMNYPDAGGAYVYARETFGYDQGFLIAWFVAMTYFAMLWANATSLPLFGRIFLGGVFSVGKMYTIFGYDVYFGEALLSMAALFAVAFLCSRNRKWTYRIMTALAVLFSAGIVIGFVFGILGHRTSLSPAFVPDYSAISQVLKIAVISPWAFIGFESISHSVEEFSFPHTKIHRILVVSVISTVLLYIFVTLLSVTAYPAQFSSWLEYIRNLDSLSGIEALPAFYAANVYLGDAGVLLLMLSLLALVITSLIGNFTSLSRLFYAMAKDKILPGRFAQISEQGVPSNAVMLVALCSVFIPFIGRTAIGWIVDVTTIGAVLIYGFVTACAASVAKKREDQQELWTARAGLVIMIALGAYFLLPNLVTKGSLATETYFMFIVWSGLGFLYFRAILQRDKKKRFGSSISVWVALLALVLIISLIWMRQTMLSSYENMFATVEQYYTDAAGQAADKLQDEQYVLHLLEDLESSNTRTMIMAIGMFGFALIVMLTNHSYMNRRTRESENLANRDPMTGVRSKHAFLVREQEIDASIKEGEKQEFAVVVCDVNGLKKINDTLGHKAGDEYIRKACTMVCDIFRHSPVFRVGGDEFVAILTGRDYSIRQELMVTLHDRSVEHIGQNEAVVSGGLAEFIEGHDNNMHDVFQRADERMYDEKKLLKSLGAVTRDDESDKEEERKAGMQDLLPEDRIINIRRHVLIAEDEAVNRELLGSVLGDRFDVIYAENGEEAMRTIHSRKDDIALVLLDLVMPKMNGREILQVMNNDPALHAIPVIVLTADQNAELECLKLGAMDFIPKPYPIWEVVKARVDRCIELSETRGIIRSTERDSLTHLLNIDYFYRYVHMFDQHYEDMSMDAVVLDINRFHLINERFGKSYGDTVLRRIGERVRQIAREIGGVGCHKGADTFLIYCPHREDYAEVLEKTSLDITAEDGSTNRVRLRLGVYSDVDKRLDIERRFDRAKTASDSVRGSFSNGVGVYDDEMGKLSVYKERLLEDFHTSIEQKRFKVWFQPKFDIRQEKPVLASAEALVRWDHPELGMISPGFFIPLLEDNGLVLELDKYVWHETAAQIRRWKDTLGFSVPISVNVSRIDMLMPDIKSVFMDILSEFGLSPDDIILELTESAYTGDSEQVISTARELRGVGMGFRIEMDDFGSGYSSLGMLANLPIDALKLDMTFVRSAFGETKDVRMIELIIDIADYLQVPVVAEGVETKEQYQVLKAMGCDLIQGYYFSKPLPVEEFEPFLIERKGESVERIPVIRKTYMNLSNALTGDFENIFYVDTVTDFYLEFYIGPDGALQIRPGGDNFYRDARDKILSQVAAADLSAMKEALRKENMIRWLGRGDAEEISFNRVEEGAEVPCCLQTIRTRGSDDHHIVIGIRKV